MGEEDIPYKNPSEGEELAINSVYTVNPVTGEKMLDASQMNYRYEIYDYQKAAMRKYRLNPAERNLNTDVQVDPDEVVMISKDTAYIDDDGNEQVKWVTWRYMKLVGGWVVYNAADVYGLPEYAAPEFVTVTDDAGLIADEFIKTSRCPIDEYDGDRAYYSPATDDIHVPARKYFNDNAGFLRTLLHQTTHSTMKPLKRREMTSWGDDAYAFEELVAELGSAFTAAAVGFNIDDAFLGDKTYADNHAAYIKSWVSHFDDEPETIFKAAALANAACLYHLDRLHGTDADATDETDADVA